MGIDVNIVSLKLNQSLTMSAGLLSFFCLLSLCSACYISNCPIGGKRAIQDLPPRQCMSCGPDDRGRCFGPSICCGDGMGCLMGSPETLHCLEEDFLPSPCETGGKVCGYEGRCAAPGVCCDSDGCSIDQSCVYSDGDSTAVNHPDLLLKLLHLSNHAHPYRLHQ